MNGKITRRQLAGIATASAVATGAAAQVSAIRDAPTDFDKAARDSHKENSEELARFDLPMSTEPAFHFKA